MFLRPTPISCYYLASPAALAEAIYSYSSLAAVLSTIILILKQLVMQFGIGNINKLNMKPTIRALYRSAIVIPCVLFTSTGLNTIAVIIATIEI
jgi:hypothetical protein